MRKKLFALSTLFIVLLSLSLTTTSIKPVEAYTYLDIYGVPTDNSDTLHPTLTQYLHSSGKLVLASGGEANTTITIWVVSTNNLLESTTNIDVGVTAEYGIEFISIGEKDADEVVIFFAHSHTAGAFQDDVTTGALFFNVNTYAYSVGSQVTTQASVNTCDVTGTRVFKYGADFYAFMIAGDFADAGTEYSNILLCKKQPDGTYSVTASGYLATAGGFSWIYGVQDTEFNGRYVYVAYSGTGYGNVHYRKYDLSLLTYQGQANQPTSSNRMPNPNTSLEMLKFNVIGGGIVNEFEAGGAQNRTWVYFTHGWTFVAGGYQNVMIVHTRLEYNETDEDLDVSNLLGIDEIVASQSTSVPSVSTAFAGGWHINDQNDNFYAIYGDITGGLFTTRIDEFTVNDPWDLGTSTFTISGTTYNPNYAPIELQQDLVGRNFSTPYQVNLYKSLGRFRVFYGLQVYEANYDVTLSWTPNDDPLYSDTWYSFTGTTYQNSIATPLTVSYFVDGKTLASLVSDSNGEFTFSGNDESGVHAYLFRVYVGTTSVYNETINLMWVDRDPTGQTEVGEGAVLGYTINTVMAFLPTFLLVGAPVFVLGSMLGGIGLISGLVVGVGIGVMSGTIPFYFMLLTLLLLSMAFVLLMRGGM